MPTIFCSQQPAPPSKSDTHDTLNPTTNHIHVNPSLAPSRPTGAISKCIIDFCFPRSLRHDITTTPLIVRDALSHTYIHITTSQTCLTSNPNSRSPKQIYKLNNTNHTATMPKSTQPLVDQLTPTNPSSGGSSNMPSSTTDAANKIGASKSTNAIPQGVRS
jgi:hypothetical protein